jgi:hypothetical protein
MALISDFLGDKYICYLSRNGFIAARRKLGGAVCFNYDRGFAGLDFVSGGRRRVFNKLTGKVSDGGRVLEDFYSQFDGDDRLLGNAFFEHARFYALWKKPA